MKIKMNRKKMSRKKIKLGVLAVLVILTITLLILPLPANANTSSGIVITANPDVGWLNIFKVTGINNVDIYAIWGNLHDSLSKIFGIITGY
jgi:hypothetical protein